MFRPVRLVVLLMIAFVAGIFFERNSQAEACAALGGDWRIGICSVKGDAHE
ncbi:hypothetical protein [Tropicibacter oceani]|uniref:Uncharacterized protein n=1 Tax=Tropicibacter oceani TaxID=3058420 RepID=A0ABY8QHZ0_9RHOB|nr:hypothetical protein [Tropicibacter oceani]WGW04264.1 hypothetical protein QF118_01625 [Tropicibacter oceani]